MKKLLFSLLLAAHVTSVSCAEKQRIRNNNNSDQTMIPVYISSATYQTNNQNYSQPGYCTANEPGWEFYDAIMNVTYKSEQPIIMNEVPLTTIYKPAPTTITQKEQKQLLQSNSLQPNKDIMQVLYKTGFNIVFNAYKGHFKSIKRELSSNIGQKNQNEQFVEIIEAMKDAKHNNINENHMIKFAYEQKDMASVNDIDVSPLGPVIFILLKKYNATVQKTGELLPPYSSSQKPSLTEILNASSNITSTVNTPNRCVVKEYPAFFQLIYDVQYATQELSIDAVKIFMKYLYKDKDIFLKNYSDGSYKDFKSEFHTKAYETLHLNLINLFINDDNCLYDLLQMIDKAKEVGDITNEDDLIKHMTAFTDIQSWGTQILNVFDSSYIDPAARKRIVLLCRLIKKYNNERGFKTNPTPNQYHAYCVKKALSVSLRKDQNNNYLLDGKSYAFTEFAALREACEILRHAKEEEIVSLF